MRDNSSTSDKHRRFAPMAELAGRQKGLVTRQQLRDLGYTDKAIESAIRNGRIWKVHRGVYAVGYRNLPPRGWELAAVLACGPERTLVSHQSAAEMWGMIVPHPYNRTRLPRHIYVSVIGAERRRYRVTATRIKDIDPCDRATIDGIPVTSPYRTLLDLAGSEDLTKALNNARAKSLVHNEGLEAVLERYPGKQGIGNFRREIGIEGFSRSKAEDLLYRLIVDHGLPQPQRNAWVAGHEVDFFWREWNLVVEVDGYRFHGTRDRFEHDHVRDTDLGLAELTVLRFTWRQITGDSDRVAELINTTIVKAETQLRILEDQIGTRGPFAPDYYHEIDDVPF